MARYRLRGAGPIVLRPVHLLCIGRLRRHLEALAQARGKEREELLLVPDLSFLVVGLGWRARRLRPRVSTLGRSWLDRSTTSRTVLPTRRKEPSCAFEC